MGVAWTPLPQNVPLVLTGSFMNPPTILFTSYNVATNTTVSGIALQTLSQQSVSATFSVHPTTSTGYQVALTYPGVYILDGQSGGQCGRVQRVDFVQ